MESLLCDEIWLTTTTASPLTPAPHPPPPTHSSSDFDATIVPPPSKEDCQQALAIAMLQELTSMPRPGYARRLRSSDDMRVSRFNVIQWIINARGRLNLSLETVFTAANYLDRFISMNQWHDWKCRMVGSLSVAALSVASKFTESFALSFDEIQTESLEHAYACDLSTIQRQEMTLLEALGWRLRSTTSYSIAELLLWRIDSLQPQLHQQLITRVTNLLLHALSDSEFLEFRPSVVAVSAIRRCSEELLRSKPEASLLLTRITDDIIPHEQRDDVWRCRKMMESRMNDPQASPVSRVAHGNSECCCPSSPVTVLKTKGGDDACDCLARFSAGSKTIMLQAAAHDLKNNTSFRSNGQRKRKREGD